MTLLIEVGAFWAIIQIIIGLISTRYIYKGYSTHVARQIRKEMKLEKEQQRLDRELRRGDPENPQAEDELAELEEIAPLPDVFEIERKFNQRVSAQGIYNMQDTL